MIKICQNIEIDIKKQKQNIKKYLFLFLFFSERKIGT